MDIEIDIEDYPQWMGDYVIDDKLPWEQGLSVDFEEFQKKYTLHDSVWIGLFYNVGSDASVTLVIQWDAFWIPEEISKSTSKVDEWPFLFIKIKKVTEVSTAGYSDIPQTAICGCEIEPIGDRYLLIISGCSGGDVAITFSGNTIFLALDCNQNILDI